MSKERDGKLQPTNDLAEAVTSAHVVEAVAKQKRVDLVEQMLYMDPIREIGGLWHILACAQQIFRHSEALCKTMSGTCSAVQESLTCHCA